MTRLAPPPSAAGYERLQKAAQVATVTAAHVRTLGPALEAYTKHKIDEKKFASCIASTISGQAYDLGAAWSVPERMYHLLARSPGLTSAELAAALKLKVSHVQQELSRNTHGRFEKQPGSRNPFRWRAARSTEAVPIAGMRAEPRFTRAAADALTSVRPEAVE